MSKPEPRKPIGCLQAPTPQFFVSFRKHPAARSTGRLIQASTMEIEELNTRTISVEDKRLSKSYRNMERLVAELQKRELPAEIVQQVNQQIEAINSISAPGEILLKQLNNAQSSILKLIEKELKLVPKNHYRNMWLALGLATFGMPLGVAFGLSLGNMAFLGIGLPIGMGIGIAVGSALDKKAFDSGNQLELELE